MTTAIYILTHKSNSDFFAIQQSQGAIANDKTVCRESTRTHIYCTRRYISRTLYVFCKYYIQHYNLIVIVLYVCYVIIFVRRYNHNRAKSQIFSNKLKLLYINISYNTNVYAYRYVHIQWWFFVCISFAF